MRYRGLIAGGAVAVVIASVSPAMVSVAGQTPAAVASTYTPPRSTYGPAKTPWGDPDIQGMWDYQSAIPMQRPKDLAGKTTFASEEEREAFVRTNAPNLDRGLENFGEPGSDVGAYNEFWHSRNFIKDNRTSLIVDPPDGRMPPMTTEAQKRFTEDGAYRRAHPYETWEDYPAYSRCMSRSIPRAPQQYNSGTLIMQSPGYVVLAHEQFDTRIIPLDRRPHIDQQVRQWNGDSRGHWEGSTLVVETTNFSNKQVGGGPGGVVPQGIAYGNVHLVERFTPVDANTMHVFATVTDPTTWTRPWTFMLPWQRDPDYLMTEYACNEGNISVGGGLSGARYNEQKAAEAAAKKGLK